MARQPAIFPPLRCLRLRTLTLTLALALALILTLAFLSPSDPRLPPPCGAAPSDLASGHWSVDPARRQPLYSDDCPFHRNAWNCIRNGRSNVDSINSYSWFPDRCGGLPIPRIDVREFLRVMKGRKVGFVGDSLNENLVVAFLCTLSSVDAKGKKWKRKKAWRGGFFPEFDVVVGYHRAVLLANYTWQPVERLNSLEKDGVKGFYRVDIDIAADDWVNITNFYDVLIFNTGHWWGPDKFPKETPLVFYDHGKPIEPALGIYDGLKVVLKSMTSHIEREVPKSTLKLWRSQSPRHFYGGEWDHNGSCLSTELLKKSELDLWFDPRNEGVNKEARKVNSAILEALAGTSIELLNLTYMSEFRADGHPAIWLGKKDAVSVWGQDCLHWCLPGVPDTWVDVLAARILHHFKQRSG